MVIVLSNGRSRRAREMRVAEAFLMALLALSFEKPATTSPSIFRDGGREYSKILLYTRIIASAVSNITAIFLRDKCN